jgi:pyrroline-5-carboxylate reductase
MSRKISIIGGGNLGTAIAEGLINSGFSSPKDLFITKRNTKTLQALKDQGAMVSDNNEEALQFGQVIILAVKPFQIAAVLNALSHLFDENKHVVVSVVSAVTVDEIAKSIGKDIAIVRAMPNTAIAIQQSMTCLAANKVDEDSKSYIENLFKQLGEAVWIDEKLMDAATVLGACGMAYAMRYIRANIQGGIQIGFSAATASLIAAQTVKGAAELLLKKQTHPEQEIDKVTTPKGCTIAGLNEMEHQGFSSSLIKGIIASYDKIVNDL